MGRKRQNQINGLNNRLRGGGGGDDDDDDDDKLISDGNISFCFKKRCPCLTQTGSRCTLEQIYELCYWHAIQEAKVKVDKSPNIEGTKGLIAFNGTGNDDEIVFPAGAEIGYYTGEMLSSRRFSNRYPDEVMAKYVVKIDNNHYVDASKDRCLMAMINSSIGLGIKSNAKFVTDYTNKTVRIVAKKNIKNLKEILLPYRIIFTNCNK